MLDKETSDQRAEHASQGPSAEHNREVLWPLPQGNYVGKDNLAHGDDATTTDALDGTPSEEDCEIAGDGCTQRSTQREEEDRDEEHLLAPKDVGQRRDERLTYSACQEVRCARPEGVG